MELCAALKKAGLSLDEGAIYHASMQVIGFQNTRYAQLSNPKLTCVEIPIYEMGNTAMSYLTSLMREDFEKTRKAERLLLAYDIIWRDSTK